MNKIFIGIVLAMITYSGFLFWSNNVLKEKLSKVEAVYTLQKTTINEMKLKFSKTLTENSKLQENLRASEQQINNLKRTLSEHNLTRLATEKPQLIENRINESTNQLFDDIRSITGN